MQVIALIHQENGIYSAWFPDFPGCRTEAADPDALIQKAAEALALHIERLIEDGREFPQVRPLARLASDPAFRVASAGRMVALIPYGPSARPVRLTITLDEALLVRLDRAAQAAGETRSAYLAEAARRRLAGAPATPERAEPMPDAVTESGSAESANPADTSASLASIREMLEHLDPSPAPSHPHSLLKPAKRTLP